MTLATGVGSFPGTDPDEAVRIVVGELPDLPHLPELPERGATASMTGRALAMVAELGADLQPAGWRLTGGGSGLDQRRARSQLGQDLDMLEEALQGFSGHLKVQVTGPWTLAATVERPRGDKVLADHGNRRELAQALAEGVRDHLADVRRRVPGAGPLLLQVDEPALGAVLRAEVPTASGFGRHRSVDRPELSEHLEWLFAAATESGAEPWVHSCAAGTPLDLLRGAGARGLSVDTSRAGLRRPRRARRGPRGRRGRGARPRPCGRPRHGSRRPSSSPTRCSAGSTGSASTRTWSVSGSSSRRPAAWRAPLRSGLDAPSPCAARSRPT